MLLQASNIDVSLVLDEVIIGNVVEYISLIINFIANMYGQREGIGAQSQNQFNSEYYARVL